MAKSSPPTHKQDQWPLEKLHFDPHNPRLTDPAPGMQEHDFIDLLYRNEDVQELLLSIRYSGWLDYEPLIVDGSTGVVYEGNRRLAALKILSDSQLREKYSAQAPNFRLPKTFKVILVPGRTEARQYIGFKHINGPKKWDAMAKAKFAAEWISAGASLEEVSRSLGDTFNTVKRLVNGWYVFEQAKSDGFDLSKTTKASFYFSHLYTAISRASVRAFLGLTQEQLDNPQPNPVSPKFMPNLKELMTWLYGQGTAGSVISSQNPDLNYLADVIGNERALSVLRDRRRLDLAWEEIDDLKPRRMEDALVASQRHASNAASLVAYYTERNESIETLTESLFKVVQKLIRDVRAVRDKEVDQQ
ncbi:MAG: hypothetical protein ING61_17355 [Rhodocyclaceae bacterium]|nr:hypothetical protein [Rhodocyclaceae bacterium]